MVRRFHRSIYDELDELRASMDYLYQLALEPTDTPPLLPGNTPDIVCRSVHTLNAEVTGNDDEVIVTVDTIPGSGNSKISIDLINETTLRITSDHEEDNRTDSDGNTVREQRSFSLHRLIPLPDPVTKYEARMNRRNGVLDIHFKRSQPVRL
jgi:HSP20 family protein